MVDFWSNADELSTKALAALSQARVSHEGVGWIRANKAAGADILSEINELRKANADLSEKLASIKPSPVFDDIDLAGLDEKYEFTVTVKYPGTPSVERVVSLTWRSILAAIGSEYRTPSNTSGMRLGLERAIQKANRLASDTSIKADIDEEQRILMQMEALGMMSAKTYSLKNGGSAVFHTLTDKGLACMLRENVVKSTQ